MCYICGQPTCSNPDFCVSQQPFCDQCANETNCVHKMDSQCVIYHFNTDVPSLLINLQLPNGTSVEKILEKIDSLIGSQFNFPFTPQDTITVKWTPGGSFGYSPQANVAISSQSGNTLVVKDDGLYTTNDGKVKVSESDVPDYLKNQIVGGTDGIIDISVIATTGSPQLLEVIPTLDLQCLANHFCDDENETARNTLAVCLLNSAFSVEDTPTIDLEFVPGVPGILTANAKISSASGNTIVENADGLYSAGGGDDLTFDNGLTRTLDNVQLGGPLTQNTEISDVDYNLKLDNNVLLLGSLSSLGYAQPAGYNPGENSRVELFHKSPLRGGSARTIGSYNAFILDDDALITLATNQFIGSIFNTFLHFQDNAAFGAATQIGAHGAFLSLSGENNATISFPANRSVAAMIASVYFENPTVFGEAISASPGTIDEASIYRTTPPTFQPGMNAGNTPTVTNLYSLFIDDLASGSATAKFTNKFGLYQVGTGDVNRFFGDVQNAGGGVEFTSDLRVKENIIPFNLGLKELEKLNPRKFNYTYKKNKNVTGLIAQEVEDIIPEAVSKGNFRTPNGEQFDDFRMVDQNTLFYTMLNAIKELNTKIKTLETLLQNK